MHWIAPSEKDSGAATLEKRLWDAADQFRANSGLKAQEYSAPVLVRLYRGEELDFTRGGDEARAKIKEIFSSPRTQGDKGTLEAKQGQGEGCVYRDVPGLCRAATLKEIEVLNAAARELEATIAGNVAEILQA